MKRALFITTHPVIGGAQKWTYDQITILQEYYEIYFATGKEGWLSDKVKPFCKEIFVDKSLYDFSSLGYLFRLYKFVKSNQINIVIASSANAGVYARLLKIFLPNLSVVYVSHGWSAIYRGNWVYQRVEKILSYLTTSILVISQDDYNKAIDVLKIDPRKLVLIENAIFPYKSNNCIDQLSKDREKITIVMIARFEYPKRQDLLIEVAKKFQNIHFNFVGEGQKLDQLKENAPYNVTFLGALTEVEPVLKKSDIFVLLSDSEGMPLSVIEALACGKPMILSDISSMRVFIEENGLLVKNDTESIVKALEEIQNMDLQSMGRHSEKIFNKRFNLLNKQKEYLSFYESLT
ncbi:MAG: hypothetical protein P794_02090 [Epsilonproteobacteria bacterium (ex Lamellibrachia satsuma)]|nr:MAG: hypothetical protein P794_02090 [Epsilonproteobacteria bacterium (ex Lamellibrachia satsuma)]